MLARLERILEWMLFFAICVILLAGSASVVSDEVDRVRAYTRGLEFDYLTWTLQASYLKFEQSALGSPGYIDRVARKQIVMEYLRLVDWIAQGENQLNLIYTDPAVADPESASVALRAYLDRLYRRQSALAPLTESILEAQVSAVLAEAGLTSGGEPIPPVLYHVTPVPMALIVSPRDAIRQDANISLLADLTVDQQAALETRVASSLDVSALVVPIGGVGVYPTMVQRTASLSWTLDTIAHEWTHNYLGWHPLGMNYDTTPALRTMNETTASIVGREIGRAVLARYYPELAARAAPTLGLLSLSEASPGPDDPPPFDFRAEMHETRLRVDELLADGRVDEAEAYMEQRRQFFWDHGYPIRKLNQAYFAFYGAYADVPGGAAGEDPVGPAVRALREQSGSLAGFVHRIAWMSSFEALQEAVK
ncbi:MAG: hypothetical protein GXP40_06050 [Chloroflexi bacterium]|nr:hypothetical protein [Chloroflexota bacterium]